MEGKGECNYEGSEIKQKEKRVGEDQQTKIKED